MEMMVIYVWPCMVVLLYDCICAWWLWPIVNEDATSTINMKGCTLSKHYAVMIDSNDVEDTRAKEE